MKTFAIKDQTSRIYGLSYSLLAVLLLITVGLSFMFYQNAISRDAARFAAAASRIDIALKNRIDLDATLLASLRGFVMTRADIDQSTFEHFVESLNLSANYSGIRSVAFVRATSVDPSSSNFGTRALIVTPPFSSDADNLEFDFADPATVAAISSASRTNSVVMGGPAGEAGDAVTTIVLPVFGDGPATDTAPNRVPVGYVCALFRPRDVLSEIERIEPTKSIAVTISDETDDGERTVAGNLGRSSGATEWL
ncbi:MAG TPA: CHASE domain-containing protein, partial [Pyrinomonadaceae bacterium]|nr:CHASE domain-containing protein [Pyrinomonadaceae bacterium]